MMSDRDTLTDALTVGIDTWPNRAWLVLPGPTDIGSELAEHLTKHLAGWRPPAREITTATELDALPVGTLLRDRQGDAWRLLHGDRWLCTSLLEGWSGAHLVVAFGPVTVLYVPTEEADRDA